MRIDWLYTAPRTQSQNARTERVHSELNLMAKSLKVKSSWPLFLAPVAAAHNAVRHATTHVTPAEVFLGYLPSRPSNHNLLPKVNDDDAKQLVTGDLVTLRIFSV